MTPHVSRCAVCRYTIGEHGHSTRVHFEFGTHNAHGMGCFEGGKRLFESARTNDGGASSLALGTGKGKFWLGRVSCVGGESDLSRNGWQSNRCASGIRT